MICNLLSNYLTNSSLLPILNKQSVDVILVFDKESSSPNCKLMAQGIAYRSLMSYIIPLGYTVQPTIKYILNDPTIK